MWIILVIFKVKKHFVIFENLKKNHKEKLMSNLCLSSFFLNLKRRCEIPILIGIYIFLNGRIPWHTIVQVHHNQTFQSLVHTACTVPKLHFWVKRWKIASFFSLIHGLWIGLDSHVCLPIKHPGTKWVKFKRKCCKGPSIYYVSKWTGWFGGL